MAGFADLNVPQGPDKKGLQSLLEAAARLGYSAVALNHVIDFKEKKQGTSKQLKVLTRLTLVVSDPSHCNLLRSTSSNIRLYDIIAVFPKTEKLFHIACTTLDVDIVCVNVTEKLPFYFRRPPVNMAIDRGIYFELLYTPAIKDSTMRRYTISNAISLMQICKGKLKMFLTWLLIYIAPAELASQTERVRHLDWVPVTFFFCSCQSRTSFVPGRTSLYLVQLKGLWNYEVLTMWQICILFPSLRQPLILTCESSNWF
uniref:Ribonuclease P/MRP subunit p30 n=1 Tax=Anas zonorhyncha TaxID=75864 RepID=A0A8B9TZJ7_9AVES